MKIKPGLLVKWNGTFLGNVRPIGLVLEKYTEKYTTSSIFNTGWWVLYNGKKAVWFEDEFKKVNQ